MQPTVMTSDPLALQSMLPDQCDTDAIKDTTKYLAVAFLGRCYVNSNTSKITAHANFANAQIKCGAIGYSLGSIFTAEENCFVAKQLPTSSPTRKGCPDCWLGMNQAGGNSLQYKWQGSLFGTKSPDLNGTVEVYKADGIPYLQGGAAFWAGNCTFDYYNDVYAQASGSCEPNNAIAQTSGSAGQDCVRFMGVNELTTLGEWGDDSCTLSLNYFCTRVANCRPGYYRSQEYVGMPQRFDPSMNIWGVDNSWNPGLCTQCAPGTYHPQTSAAQTLSRTCMLCDAGYFGDKAATSNTCSGQCPAGYYCPAGTARSTIAACPEGTYNPYARGTSLDSCLTTPSGRWSSTAENRTVTLLSSCAAGRCGYGGATSSACHADCPPGYYCNAGTSCFNQSIIYPGLTPVYPAPCGANNKWSSGQASGSCSTATAGFYTEGGTNLTRTAARACLPGSYCPGDGNTYFCPAGTYSAASQAVSNATCLPCKDGFYCPPGSTTATAEYCGISQSSTLVYPPAAYYCPAGTPVRLIITSSLYYTTPLTNPDYQRYGYAICGTESICANGTSQPRFTWSPGACSDLGVPENSLVSSTGRFVSLIPSPLVASFDYVTNYTFTSALTLNPCTTYVTSQNNLDVNPSRIALNVSTGEIYTTQSLDFEQQVCKTGSYSYAVSVTAMSYSAVLGQTSVMTCAFKLSVLDRNDAPYWPNERDSQAGSSYPVAYRAIPEQASINTLVSLCDAAAHVASVVGCPALNDLITSPQATMLQAKDPDAADTLRYTILSGVGDAPADPNDNPFKINSCTGSVSMRLDKVIRFVSIAVRPDPFNASWSGRYYYMTVRVTDSAVNGLYPPALSADFPLVIYITPIPNPPILEVGKHFFVLENRPAGQVIGNVSAEDINVPAKTIYYRLVSELDSSYFYLRGIPDTPSWDGSAPYEIVTNALASATIDYYSTKQTYSIKIEARNCLSLSCPPSVGGTDVETYDIQVNKTNHAPVFQDVFPFFVRENSAVGTPVCFDSSASCDPAVGGTPSVIDAVQVTDVDTGVDGDVTIFSLVETPGDLSYGIFTIDPGTGQIYVNSPSINFENDSLATNFRTGRAYTVTVRANSTGPIGGNDAAWREQAYSIFVINVNEPPAVTIPGPLATTFFVLETFAINSQVEAYNPLEIVSVVDPDNEVTILKNVVASQQTITFSRSPSEFNTPNDDLGTLFSVGTDPTTGRFSIKLLKSVDYESIPPAFWGGACGTGVRCYIISIRASDNGFPSASVDFTVQINVLDVNDAPSFLSSTLSVDLRETADQASQIDLTGEVDALSDADDASFLYWIDASGTSVGYDSYFVFENTTVSQLGFRLSKRAGAKFYYASFGTHVSTRQFTILIRGADVSTRLSTASMYIGRSCSLLNPSSCGDGAYCANNYLGVPRCYELCTTTLSGLNGSDVHHAQYFCDYAGNGTAPVTPYTQQEASNFLTLTVNVLDDNDPPYIVDDDNDPFNDGCYVARTVTVQQKGFVQTPVPKLSVTDVDTVYAHSNFTFEEVDPNAAMWATFNLSSTTGSIAILNPYPATDLVLGESFVAEVRVLDDWPPPVTPLVAARGNSTCTINITVINFNHVPVFPQVPIPTLPENTDLGQEVLPYLSDNFSAIDIDTLLSTPPDQLTFRMNADPYFSLDPITSRIVTAGKEIDYETLATPGAYTLVVRITDSYGAETFGAVVINVTDVNEAPVFSNPPGTPYTLTINENSLGGTPLFDFSFAGGLLSDPDVNPEFRQPPDLLITSALPFDPFDFNFPFEVSEVDGYTLQVKAGYTPSDAASVLDFEGGVTSWVFSMEARDVADSSLKSATTVRISLRDVNEPPHIDQTTPQFVNEGAEFTTLLDLKAVVTDPDARDNPVATKLDIRIMAGDDSSTFEIVNGVLRVRQGKSLDYESTQAFNLTIRATDAGGLFDEKQVLIYVLNVNDVTISSMSIISGPNVASQKLGCAPSDGVSTVEFLGTNLGLTSYGSGQSPQFNVSFTRVTAAGESPAPVFYASTCWIHLSNTAVRCNVTTANGGGGAGTSITWRFAVSVSGTQIAGDSATLVSSNAFPKPTLTSLSFPSSGFATLGGESFTLRGTCLGTPADTIIFRNTGYSVDSWIEMCTAYTGVPSTIKCRLVSAASCITATNGTLVSCPSASLPGMGVVLSWRVRIAGQTVASSLAQGFYIAPQISAATIVSSTNPSGVLSTYGGDTAAQTIVLTGTNFSPFANDMPTSAYLVYNKSGAVHYFNLLNCRVSTLARNVTCTNYQAGVGGGLSVRLVFGDQTSTDPSAGSPPSLSYAKPIFNAVHGDQVTSLSTLGKQLVQLTGDNFGPTCGFPGTSEDKGGINCDYVVTSYTRYSARASPPFDMLVYVPTICAVVSQTEIVCTTVEGTGANHTWTLNVGGRLANNTDPAATISSYGNPVVATYLGPGATGASTRGGVDVFIVGANFGPTGGASVSAAYGNKAYKLDEFTALNCSVTTSHTEIKCTIAPGAGDDLAWIVKVDDLSGTNQQTDYGIPVIESITVIPGPTSTAPAPYLTTDGNDTVVINGHNFGTARFLESVTLGPLSNLLAYDLTSACVLTSPHFQISCVTPPGVGTQLQFKVTVRKQSSSAAEDESLQISFATPRILAVNYTKISTQGGDLLSVFGDGFALCDPFAKIYVTWSTPSSDPGTYTLLDVVSYYDTGLPVGSASVSLTDSAVAGANVALAPPLGCPYPRNTVKRVVVIVPPLTDPSRQASIGLRVKSGKLGGGGFVDSLAPRSTLAYDPPVLDNIYVESDPVNIGLLLVTLFGSNLCDSNDCCWPVLQGQVVDPSDVSVHTDSLISFSSGSTGSVYVACSDGSVTKTITFAHNSPKVIGTVPELDTAQFATAGGDTLEVWGLYFGLEAPNVTIGTPPIYLIPVSYNAYDCATIASHGAPLTALQQQYDPGAVCYRFVVIVPAGVGSDLPLRVIAVGFSSHPADLRFEFLSYHKPQIQDAEGSAMSGAQPCAGGGSLILDGLSFGIGEGEVYIGGTDPANGNFLNALQCNITSWQDNHIECTVPVGEGENLPISVVQNGDPTGYATSLNRTVTFAPPDSVVIAPDSNVTGLTQGGEILHLVGNNFGRPYRNPCVTPDCSPFGPQVTINGQLCRVVSSTLTDVYCLTPEGEGADNPIVLAVLARSVPSSNTFDYAPPELYSVTPSTNLPTSGYYPDTGVHGTMTIYGKNFGVNRIELFFNGNALVAQRDISSNENDRNTFLFINHTMLVLYIPPYLGANLTLSVVVHSQFSTSPDGPVTVSYAKPTITLFSVPNQDGTVTTNFSADQGVVLPNSAWDPTGAGIPFGGFGSGRRRRRRELSSSSSSNTRRSLDGTTVASYGFWTTCYDEERTICTGSCDSDFRAQGVFWKVQTDIAPNGEYRRIFTHYDSKTVSNCPDGSETYRIQVEGQYADLGPSPVVTCGGRTYSDTVTKVEVTILDPSYSAVFQTNCPCGTALKWDVGSTYDVTNCISSSKCSQLALLYDGAGTYYGTYIISENKDLFLSATDPTQAQAEARTAIKLSDFPIASVEDEVDVSTPQGPTDGCYEWEPIRDYVDRAAIYAAQYGVPVNSVPRECLNRATVVLHGSNFGDDSLGIPDTLRVAFINNVTGETFWAATTTSAGSHAEVCPRPICIHTHDLIIFQVPFGIGRSLLIDVFVGNQDILSPVRFSYFPPILNEVNPGTLFTGRPFASAEGEGITIYGSNFGGRLTNASVLINGRRCENALWNMDTSLNGDGSPFVTCDSTRDVVGPKSVMLCIADQVSMRHVFRSDGPILVAGEEVNIWDFRGGINDYSARTHSIDISRCPAGLQGRLYELCSPCPNGASCNNGSFLGPSSLDNFFGQSVPIFNPDGTITDRAKQLCAPNQYNLSLLDEYPDLKFRASCEAFNGCEPPSACKANNTCSTGYEYTLYTCNAKRGYKNATSYLGLSAEAVFNTSNGCRVQVDPYTGEYSGISADCRSGLDEFETCTADHPEQCSTCEVLTELDPSDPTQYIHYGVCKCEVPTRCSLCTVHAYYRINNQCQPCPDNPGLLIGGLFLAAIAVAFLGWFLTKKNVNLAFVTIGIDYFQVLAVLSTTNVPWPPAVKELMQIMSIFNFNIDITAPECLVPNLEYEVKWWLTMAIPAALAIVLAIVGGGYTAYKLARGSRSTLRTKSNLFTHVSTMIAIFIVTFYYLYLSLTKRALDVFNCNPATPDDGYLYTTFTSLQCDGGGLCRCDDPGGPQQRLVPMAATFLAIYSCGYPLFIFYILRRNQFIIQQDQYIRAFNIGFTRATNPTGYDVRKRYSKLYYQFKPRFAHYWILVLIMRKFWVAFASLIFRGSPAFQLAVILLVLFASLVLQILWRPYMSTGERMDVCKELSVMAERAITEPEFLPFVKMRQGVENTRNLNLKFSRKMKEREKRRGRGLWSEFSNVETEIDYDEAMLRKQKIIKKNTNMMRSIGAARYFANLNTLEFILLGCGILVCLAGIMFEASQTDKRALVGQQVQGIAWFLIVIIVTSLLYYLMFFLAEIAPAATTFVWNHTCRKLVKRGEDDDGDENQYQDDDLKMEENPMFSSKEITYADNTAMERRVEAEAEALERAEAENKRLRALIKEKKVEGQVAAAVAGSESRIEGAPRVNRKEFAQRRVSQAMSLLRARTKRPTSTGPDDVDEENEELARLGDGQE